MHRSSSAGQAAAEYVAVLLVVAAVLAGRRRSRSPSPASASAWSQTVRTGMCIVGGDVCRDADAAAAGLAPCVTGERSTRQETTLDLAVVRLGGTASGRSRCGRTAARS